jgi:protein involved in polysaccharide export with SLBB domain
LAEPEKPIVGKVTVAGAVGRQGPLDLEEGLRLMKAIDLAGGALKDADLRTVHLIHKDLTLEVVDLSKDNLVTDPNNNRVLRDGDSVNVPSIPAVKEVPDSVSLDGAPGALTGTGSIEIGPAKVTTLQSLLGGKLMPAADFKHVTLQRQGEAEKVYDLQALSEQGLRGNVELKAGDKVFVPVQHDKVFLLGAVPKPGVYGLQPGQHISDFFIFPDSPDVAAALGQQVDLQHVQVFRPNKPAIEVNLKAVMKARQKGDVKQASAKGDVTLEPGDSILLLPREEKNKKSPIEYLGQLGGLASLFSIF